MRNPLCKYKNILGEPGVGWRKKYRIFDISYIDALVVIAIGFAISKIMKYNLLYTLVVLFFLGIIVHRMFCVRTRIDRWIFG